MPTDGVGAAFCSPIAKDADDAASRVALIAMRSALDAFMLVSLRLVGGGERKGCIEPVVVGAELPAPVLLITS